MNFLFVILSGYYPIPVTSCASQAPLNYYWGAEMRTYVLQRFFFLLFFRRRSLLPAGGSRREEKPYSEDPACFSGHRLICATFAAAAG